MDIRIDSVFSLNTKDADDDSIFRIESTENCLNMPKQSEIFGEKNCFVSVERIDIGTKKCVSYRTYMKTHTHCDSNCLKTVGEKRNSESVPDTVQEPKTKRVTRSARKRELDTSSTLLEPLAKRKKQSHEELQESVETRCNKTEINQDINIGNTLNEEILQSLDKQIKKEPEDTIYESIDRSQKRQIKEVRSNSAVKIKTETPAEESFTQICEALARAPVGERASYMEKLRSIYNKEEGTKNNNKPDPRDIHTPSQLIPTQTSDSKTLAALQLVMIDGKSYVIPTATSSFGQTGNAATGRKKVKGERKIESPTSKAVTVSVASLITPAASQSTTHVVSLPILGSEHSTTSVDSFPTLGSNQSTKPVASLPTLVSNQSNVKSAFNNALSNINNGLSSNLSLMSTSNLTNNVNIVTTVPSAEKRPSDATEKKEIHGHLVTHPDGKQYFVPLGGGQTFSNKPLIQLEPIQVGSSSSSPLPLGMMISSSSQNALQKLSSSLPIPPRSDKTCKTSSSIVINNTETSLENKKGQNILPKTIILEKSPMNELVTEYNIRVAPKRLPKNTTLPKSNDLALVNTKIGDASKTTNSQIMTGNEMFAQIQNKSSTTTSVNFVTSQMQTNPTATSTANACGQAIVPLLINGVVQNVLMNTLPNGTLTLPSQDKTVITSECIDKTIQSRQDAIIPNNHVQKGVVNSAGIQTIPSLINPVQPVQFGGLHVSQQGISQNQLNPLSVLTLNTGQLTNQIVQPGPIVAQNLQPILNPVLSVGQLLSNTVQSVPVGSKGNPIEISASTTHSVKPSANALPIQINTNQPASVQSQTNSSGQVYTILPTTQILSPTLQGIPTQSRINQTENGQQIKSSMINPVLTSGHSIPFVQQNIQLLPTNMQAGNIQAGINQPKFKPQSSVIDTKQVCQQAPNIDQSMTIFLQSDTAKKQGVVYQQPGAPVVPTPEQNIVLNQLQQQGFNVGIVQQSPSFPNNSQQFVFKNLVDVSSNQSVRGNPANSGVKNVLPTPNELGPVSQVLSSLASKSRNSGVASKNNRQITNTQKVIGSSAIHSIKPSVSRSSISDNNASNKMASVKANRSYSPSELCKNVTKSKDYTNQIEGNVIGVRETTGNVVPMFLNTSTGQVVPFSVVKPTYETIINAGNLVTSLLTTNSSVAATANPRSVSDSSTPDVSLIPGNEQSYPRIFHDGQNPQIGSNSRLSNAPVVSPMKSHSHDQSNVTLIPAQGYTKSSSSAQLSQNITQSHPLLQQSLRTSQPNETARNNSVVTTTSDRTKRNKRKPQVVVHIDKEYPDFQENTPESPDRDYSIFMVPSVSTSSATKSIVEKGLRIPDSMLQELQKKQLAMESTVQKLKLNKHYSSASGQP